MVTVRSVRFGLARVGKRRFWVRDIWIFPDDTIRRRPLGRWLRQHHAIGQEDMAPLVAAGATAVVIGMGMFSRARVKDEARAWAQGAHIELIVLPSRQAAEKFNDLQAAGRKIGALLHLMC